jgi:hypothetical protein
MDSSRRSFLQRTAAVAGGIGSGLVPSGASADDTAPDAPELPQQQPMSKAARLRARLQEPGLIVAPSVDLRRSCFTYKRATGLEPATLSLGS